MKLADAPSHTEPSTPTGHDWFDWLSLAITVTAAAVPAWIAITLWRSDRRIATDARREAAIREFTHLLANGDRVLVLFRDFGYFTQTMGPGAEGLFKLISRYMEWDRGDEEREGADPVRIDLSVDVSHAIHRWNADPEYRADLTEVSIANNDMFLVPEDNRIISPATRRRAENEVLERRAMYAEWLRGTRLSPTRIRWRRIWESVWRWKKPLDEPLNPLAELTYLEDDDLEPHDLWMRERSTAESLVAEEENE